MSILTKPELIAKAASLGILRCKSKTKGQILDLIMQHEQSPSYNPMIIQEQEPLTEGQEPVTEGQEQEQEQEQEQKQIHLYKGDAVSELDKVPNNSIQTVCIDPPYNIGKDHWDTINNYVSWLTNIVVQLEKKMRTNGSMFIFHNDMEQIAELMISIKSNTKLVFRQMIVWNKRFDKSKKKGFLDGFVVKNEMHNWNKMAEYILFYTFDNSQMIKEERTKQNVSQMTISQEIKSKTGGLTGWFSNIETGKNQPTRETMVPITKHLGLQYDDIVPKFRNLKTDHSVWNYDMAPRNGIHLTPKPIDLLKNIILHTTDENDMLLDCFAGSGSLGYACRDLNRRCILIEKDAKYCEYIEKQLHH
jgi:site-specific DNA-methyltransferase (adenine-specific)